MNETDLSKLRNRGLNVFPLKPKSKFPMGTWKEFQSTMYNDVFPPGCNYGIVCGAISGNLFVLDLDDISLYKYFQDFHTFTVKTGKGYHLYFRSHGLNIPSMKTDDSIGRHIDIKSEGGYVLAPGSIHPDTNKTYDIINDVEIKVIDPSLIKQRLMEVGFDEFNERDIEKIKSGSTEGDRNNNAFKYVVFVVNEYGLSGTALKEALYRLNEKNNPPLPTYELDNILSSVTSYVNLQDKIKDKDLEIEKFVEGVKPRSVTMQEINTSYEGILVSFDGIVTGVSERFTFTTEAEFICPICSGTDTGYCDEYYIMGEPYCKDDKRKMNIINKTKITDSIQLLRIEEFLETARENTPVEYDAEIIGDDVGEAFMSQKKRFTGRFRSISEKGKRYNKIIFQITSMTDLEQTTQCLPSEEELIQWRKIPNIFEKVTNSIAPEMLINPLIKQAIMLSVAGGVSLNGKRADIHVALPGDAQLGKSELLKAFHELIPGSGLTVGTQSTGVGLTVSMVKSHTGALIPKAGFLPKYTGYPVFIDEGDKMKPEDMDAMLQCMEQQIAVATKAGYPNVKFAAVNSIVFAGNPKHGKFIKNIPIMQQLKMSEPFLTRFDIIFLVLDENNEELDDKIRKHIREFRNDNPELFKKDELQRYFTYVRTLRPTIPKLLEVGIDALHKKMRKLNTEQSGINIGMRQYYGLNRLVTACASCNLRNEATQEDLDIVKSIISAALKSLDMNLESGQARDIITSTKNTKSKCFDITWSESCDSEGTINKDEFIIALSKTDFYTGITAETIWDGYVKMGKVILLNDTGRYRLL